MALVVVPLCTLTLVLALVAAGIHARRCTDNGGTWVHVNCHTVEDQSCMTLDYGNDMPIMICQPTTSRVCDTICVGASAEAR